MRIVHYHPRALTGDGGITNSVRRLSLALAELGARPAIAYDGRSSAHHDEGVDWIPVTHVGPSGMRLPTDARSALAEADLVVLNSGWTAHNALLGAMAARRGVPYVLAPRGAYDPALLGRRRLLKRVWWTLIEHRLVRRARAMHAFFDTQQAHHAALGHHGASLIAPNGVAIPAGVNWDGGSGGYILYMGRFDPEHKGLDLLVRAVASIPEQRRPTLRLHGPDWRGGKERVTDLVEELRLQRWISVRDPVYGDQKWATISSARGFVYPSRWEAFGNSLAEACAVGVPALATPYPLARYLADREACLVAEPNTHALAAQLVSLERSDAAQLGQRAAAIMAEEFSWQAVAERWLAQACVLADLSPSGS